MTPSRREYEELRNLVESGNYESASGIVRGMREGALTSEEARIFRALISARLSFKTFVDAVDIRTLEPNQTRDAFLKAELHFVRGLCLFHKAEFSSGADDFLAAAEAYERCKLVERALLSRYNHFIGKLNSGGIASDEQGIETLRPLEGTAAKLDDRRTLGLIRRQKSYFFQTLGRPHAAYEEAASAARELELHGARSDFQMALIQAADCALDLGDKHRARMHLDYLLGERDARILFPLAMVEARLAGSAVPDPSSFEIASPFWTSKLQKRSPAPSTQSAIEWDLKKKHLRMGRRKIPLRESSVQGKLIRILSSGKRTKSEICEKLWPEACGVKELDNRFHRLVSHLNRKAPGLITWDGSTYALSGPLSAG